MSELQVEECGERHTVPTSTGECAAKGFGSGTRTSAPGGPDDAGGAPHVNRNPWPSTLPAAHLDACLKSVSNRIQMTAEDRGSGGTGKGGTGRSLLGVCATERVEEALNVAFERLWREQPPAITEDDEKQKVMATIDEYIGNYFRRVAELNRECVYQSHQKRILKRMREDVIRGDRCGNLRDLDEKISKADGDESTVQTDIAQMMKILDPKVVPACPSTVICCSSVMPQPPAGAPSAEGEKPAETVGDNCVVQ